MPAYLATQCRVESMTRRSMCGCGMRSRDSGCRAERERMVWVQPCFIVVRFETMLRLAGMCIARLCVESPCAGKRRMWPVAAMIALAFMGSLIVSPLYVIYQRAFGFSDVTLTLVYATY